MFSRVDGLVFDTHFRTMLRSQAEPLLDLVCRVSPQWSNADFRLGSWAAFPNAMAPWRMHP
jgi:hypothetical protein